MRTSIYLASASPRRRELLRQLGVDFDVLSVEVDETPYAGEGPRDVVQRLALAKARAGWLESDRNRPVLGADTVVVVGNHTLGKPVNREDAERMLTSLSACVHEVCTGVALVQGGHEAASLSVSKVTFKELSEREIGHYLDTGEPIDKAGAYAIQGRGAMFVVDLQGSYSGVVGLPLRETAALLAEFGVDALANK
ncbi:MAG: Maf family protein [Gammaproteobacteria bacterium]